MLARALAAAAAVPLALCLAAAPAHAAPNTGSYDGPIASINTKANLLVLPDGTRLKYGHPNTVYLSFYLYDYITEEGEPDCNMQETGNFDSRGGGGTFELLAAQPGAQIQAYVQPRAGGKKADPTVFLAQLSTCDGVITEADLLY